MVFDLATQKYISFSTYRANGEEKSTPVWVADLGDGTFGFNTPGDSWKVKRLAVDSTIKVRPCSMRGAVAVEAPAMHGTAIVVQGAAADRIHDRIQAKYKFAATLINSMENLGSLLRRSDRNRVGIVITLD